jgi:DNA-binding PadR family transcriptional regulator
MAINKELLKGSTATMILTLLSRKQMYGYEIIKELEFISSGVFEMKEGTLYPILHSLEDAKFVESQWVGPEGSRQRKYYLITKLGRGQLKEKKLEWIEFRTVVDKIILG